MEAALASLATSAGTGAAATAAGAAIGPVTAAASGLGTISTIGSFVSPLLTVGSALSSVAGGMQGAAVSKAQSRQAELAARQEELRGREQADKIRRGLSASLASQNAIFAARGISPYTGTPQTIAGQSATQASYDIDIARFGATQSAGALRSQAGQYAIEGKAKMTSGLISGGRKLYSLVE